MSRRVLARCLIALLALGGVAGLAPAPDAVAATEERPEVEGTNWYWRSQNRTSPSKILDPLGIGCPPFAPACPDPVVGLPNPHEPGALPVMVMNGEIEKISAIDFDTEFLPPQGAEIDRFVFTIIESQDARDRAQTFNAEGRKIRACLIEDIWPSSEEGADEMQYAPPYNCDNAAEGVRKEGEAPTDPVRWEFDLTNAVAAWGEDPFSANGVMLVPVVEGSGILETWQIVLKGPRRDMAETPIDEAEPNKNNIQAQISYTPNPEEDDGTDLDGGSDFDTGGDFDPAPVDTTEPPAEEPPAEEPPAQEDEPASEPVSDTAPGSAWYVWLLLPAAIFGIGMVRAAVLEPASGRREGGVVWMIRQQNAARRGWVGVPDEPVSPFSRLLAPFTALGAAVRSDLSNARTKLRKRG